MIVFILGGALMLGVCIFIHELGHFLFGKLVGVKAEVFSMGYGRGIWKKKIGDTTYQITAIPLGGYVKFYGAEDMDQTEKVPGGFYTVGPIKRMVPVLGGPLFNLFLGGLIFLLLHSLSGPIAPRIQLLNTVGRDGTPAHEAGLQNGDLVQSIDGRPTQDFHDVVKAVVLSEGKPLDFEVLRNNESVHVTVKPDVDSSGRSAIGIRMPGEMRLQVNYPNSDMWWYNFVSIFGPVEPPRSLRAIEHLHDGDVILAVEDQDITSVRELQKVLGEHHGQTVSVHVRRESLPWLAPWFEHETTVEVPSSGEYIIHLRDVVDAKYGRKIGDQFLASTFPEHQKRLSEIWIDGKQPGSFPNLAERFAAGRRVSVSMGGKSAGQGGHSYEAFVEAEKTGVLGFMPGAVIQGDYLDNHESFTGVLAAAYQDTVKNIMIYPTFFGSLFSGRVSFIDNAAGPVRIFGAAGMLMKSDYQNYLQLFAAISIALFIMNLIPFPIVDGGHIVFFLYEAIAGKPVSPRVMEAIYRVAFSMILFLGLWIMYRDVIWFIGL